MQQKLKQLRTKQNDIGQYEREQRRIKIQMQQYNQNLNYSQAKFFGDCQTQLKAIAEEAQREQKVLRERQKIKSIKKKQQLQQPNQTDHSTSMLMINIVIDFLRSQNMNYSYSVITREKNIITEDIVMRSDLANVLSLKEELQSDCRFNVSVLELILQKLNQINEQTTRKKQSLKEFATQCELITNLNQHNNILLTELKLQQIRNQTQQREKKHFQHQLHLFKSQELLQIKSQMNKMLQTKTQQITNNYQAKIQQLIAQKAQSQPNQQQAQRLQQYLNEINTLKQEIRTLREKNLNLEREKLQHDCFQNQQIKNKIKQIDTQRKQLNQLKSQFEFALKNMGTKVEDLALQKQQIMTSGRRQTQEYLSKMKTHKETKDYMIEKVYSTIKTFQLRINNLSNDNNKLYQENFILRNQLDGLKMVQESQIKREQESRKHASLSELKVSTKNVSIGVTPEQFQVPQELQQSKVQSQQSDFTYTSEEFKDRLRSKAEQNQKINKLKLQMSLLKNKVKYLVMDFQ